MGQSDHIPAAEGSTPRRLFYYNAGFLRQAQVRRILALAGYDLALGLPKEGDGVAVWGHSPYAKRGEAVAAKQGVPIVRIEDSFLRSMHPGRAKGEPPIGLIVDHRGMHFDPAQPSDLEHILATHPLDDSALLNRGRACLARMKEAHLTKYCAVDPGLECPDPGYVLVIDQTRGDASVRMGRANANSFKEMLFVAQEEHPQARIVIKTHPETRAGERGGYFSDADVIADPAGRISICDQAVSTWALMEGAIAVYTVSSQMGFEAIMAGHVPRVFGHPFYAGWGLTQDEAPMPRRGRKLTRAQMFAAVMMLYPIWYDPYRDQLCQLEQVLDTLEARARVWREDRHGWTASGMRLWKRGPMNRFFGSVKAVVFDDHARPRPPRRTMVWGVKPGAPDAVRVEDGFLRSRGLGADLVPPLSLVLDDLGLYYDPRQPSRLEQLIASRATLRPDQEWRAQSVMRAVINAGLSKYNVGGEAMTLPEGHRILVPGQVEDDASIHLGTGEVSTNLDLLRAVRAANPEAVILYKPHPDVEAGLRKGAVPSEEAQALAHVILDQTDMAAILTQVQEVWTMTSGTGFEALLRGVKVTTLGAPFYAGWGLTRHLGPPLGRRVARPSLAGLVHAVLIDYPRYYDPITQTPCPVEVVIDRLATGRVPRPGFGNRILAKAQGLFAGYAYLWR